MRGIAKVNEKFYWTSGTTTDSHWLREIRAESSHNKVIARVIRGLDGWVVQGDNIGTYRCPTLEDAKDTALAELVSLRMDDGKPS